MPTGDVLERRASLDARSVGPTRDRAADPAARRDQASGRQPHPPGSGPAHRASSWIEGRRAVGIGAVLAALGAAAVTTVLIHPGPGPEPSANPGSQVVTDLDPGPASGDTREITCWDGTPAVAAADCGVPEGRSGLMTVFPSLDERCTETDPVVAGKLEVFTCRGEGFVVRYTRWEPGFDRFAVFSEENGGLGYQWTLGDDFAGRRWASQGTTSDGVRHFLWTATYRAQPFSVEVQATTKAGRSAGIAAVDARLPRRLGRS